MEGEEECLGQEKFQGKKEMRSPKAISPDVRTNGAQQAGKSPFVFIVRFWMVCSCIMAAALLPAHPAVAEPAGDLRYRIGVSARTMGDIDFNDAAAALIAWADTIQREQRIQGNLKAELLVESAKQVSMDFKTGKYDGIGLTTEEFFHSGLSAKDIYIGVRGNDSHIRYVIIGPANLDHMAPADLLGRTMVTSRNNQMLLAAHWLELLLNEHAGNLATYSPVIVGNPEKAIFQVFFRQADVALISSEAYELACELNPQLRVKTRVFFESPPLISSLFMFQSGGEYSKDLTELEKAIVELQNSVGGKQVLTVMQSSRMQRYPVAILATTIDLLREFERIPKTRRVVDM